MFNHFCSWHISMRTWKKLAQKLEWEESMHIPRAEYAWKQKFASRPRHPPGTHIKIHILQIPILKFRTPFWHYQDNPLTPSIHCQDTIDFQLSIFNKENLYDRWVGGWVGGWFLQEILPLCVSILQVGTCQIFSLAENPRWSRVWQYVEINEALNDKQRVLTKLG